MRAFVLGGGGNYGAIQVGAMDVLIEHGYQPDMMVGISAGALNAAWLCGYPTRAGIRRLAQIWSFSAPEFFPPISRMQMLVRLAKGRDSLLSNTSLQEFIRKWDPEGRTFADLAYPRLYVVAARMDDGTMQVFGDDPAETLLNGLMASTALPPIFPPWMVNGIAYVDGALISSLPLQVAIDRGATEIFALHIRHTNQPDRKLPLGREIVTIGESSIKAMTNRITELEIEAASRYRGVDLHLIPLCPTNDPGFWNFSGADQLIADGRRAVENYLADRPVEPTWRERWLGWLHRAPWKPKSISVPVPETVHDE